MIGKYIAAIPLLILSGAQAQRQYWVDPNKEPESPPYIVNYKETSLANDLRFLHVVEDAPKGAAYVSDSENRNADQAEQRLMNGVDTASNMIPVFKA